MTIEPSRLPVPERVIDPEILPLCLKLCSIGLTTSFSCAGFGPSRNTQDEILGTDQGHDISCIPYVRFSTPRFMPLWLDRMLAELRAMNAPKELAPSDSIEWKLYNVDVREDCLQDVSGGDWIHMTTMMASKDWHGNDAIMMPSMESKKSFFTHTALAAKMAWVRLFCEVVDKAARGYFGEL